jgi:FK506-binding nuclear protein
MAPHWQSHRHSDAVRPVGTADQHTKAKMAFWGLVVKPGKESPYVPPPENWTLHLSQASLPATTKENTRVSILAKLNSEDPGVIICTLNAGKTDSVPLDLFFDRYVEFKVLGGAAGVEVHLSGEK